MYLFIIRHAESVKNKENQFSSSKDDECLTPKGESVAMDVAKRISDFAIRNSLTCNTVYSANSVRSLKTAEKVAGAINARIQIEEDLRSTRPGALAGVRKDQVRVTHPEYAQQYYLFEKGVFNVYDFSNPEGKEPKKAFEQRVNSCVDRIIADKNDGFKVIVAHNSSITAILLGFARKYHKYPENFSGHIPLDLGHVSILRENDGKWEILKVNEDCRIIDKF